jgi:hypothetical protein
VGKTDVEEPEVHGERRREEPVGKLDVIGNLESETTGLSPAAASRR